VFSWNIKGTLVPRSIETILREFEKRLAVVDKATRRIDNLEGRVKVLESEFDEFKEMDVLWAQEMEVRLDDFRGEMGLVVNRATSGADSESDDYDLEEDPELGLGMDLVDLEACEESQA
jgi:hypothetical protein